jgi:hypothetical protein
MSPSPEFYLKTLTHYGDRERKKTIEEWGNAQFTYDNRLFLCNFFIKDEAGSTILNLDAIIETDWGYLGCGRLIIPTRIVYRTEKAERGTPSLIKHAGWNTEHIGAGYVPQILPLFGIDPLELNKEIVIKNDKAFYAIDRNSQTNQNTTEIHGVVFERNIRKLGESWSWRASYLGNDNDLKLNIISAMGLTQSLETQFSRWKISPSYFSP